MPTFKSNELEFQGFVAGWLTEFLAPGSYPFDTAAINSSLKMTETKTKFPDVVLWNNYNAKIAYCGWELKTPTTKADDAILLDDAAKKAHVINAPYFVTWNMRDAIIWETPKANDLVKAAHKRKQYTPLYAINTVDDLKNEQNFISLKNRAREILDDLTQLKKDGTIHNIQPEATYFVKRLHEAVKSIYPDVEKALKKKSGLDRKFRGEMNGWATKQGINNPGTDEFFTMIARQMVYRLLARIIFYETITGAYPHLPKLDLQGLAGQKAIDQLKQYFTAAGNIDWTAVFEPDMADTVELTADSINIISQLIDELNKYNFKLMPQDVIGAVFEQLIPEEERHTLGQYFTREPLVDLINAFCIQTTNATVLDPTCGTGTFLLRAYDKKKTAGIYDHAELLGQIWGIDIANFPAELATINMFNQKVAEVINFPRVVRADFFDIKPGQKLKFPPLKKNPNGVDQHEVTLPMFDAAVGNFPFIRQELIEKAAKGYKAKLNKVIKEDWLAEYPDAFKFEENDKKYIMEAHKSGKDVTKFNAELNLSGQADIYAYLFFHTARFVKQGGRLGFITSNSWLDVAYGYELQRFMLNNFKIVAILESRCEPWFADAAVNTVVTVLERCANKAERDNNITKFVKIKKKLADLIPQNMKLEANERWSHLQYLVDVVEKAGEEHLEIEKSIVKNDLTGLETALDDDNFRVRIKKQGELLDELNQEGKTAKWGQYLRAPEVYFRILEKSGAKAVRLKDLANINFGIKTGVNKFFYLTTDMITHHGIENEFVKTVVTSSKEVEGLTIDTSKTKYKVFVCSKTKEELKKTGKLKALKYIEWGETQKTEEGVNWNKTPSVKGRALWWDVGAVNPGDFMINRFVGERFYMPVNPDKIFLGDVVFEGAFKNTQHTKMGTMLANSSLTALSAELEGRLNLGEGLLTTYGPEIERFIVADPAQITDVNKIKLEKAFDKLSKRPVKPIFEEVKMKDRREFDSLVLEAIGLDPKAYLKPLYEGLTELVRERIELGKMRTKVKKANKAKDIEKIKTQVIDIVIPKGAKKFPEDFLEKALKTANCETVSIPMEKLKLGGQFLTEHEIYTDDGYKYMAPGTATAKYIVYSQKSNTLLVQVPKDETIASQAVQNYEIYLKGIKEDLLTQALNMTADHKQAEMLAEQIFEEYGLPLV
ncbi:MAG: N-6 DNA methylase [Dehalococcoidales bacterium]|nr:N-6 DNA methylase [Dehalococcoidales bacterium]